MFWEFSHTIVLNNHSRALDVFYKKKRKLSEILKEQQSAEDSSTSGGGLRFSNAIILWLQCDQVIIINFNAHKLIRYHYILHISGYFG